MLRRLAIDQPEKFQFTKSNLNWAKAQLKKYLRETSQCSDTFVVESTRAGRLGFKACNRICSELFEYA